MCGIVVRSGADGSVSGDQGLTIFDDIVVINVDGGSVFGDRAADVSNRVYLEPLSGVLWVEV